ncbi:hypothetical protein RHMOL_Rhmol09G0215100 [Rhododendron molle]|uniref:Uncharacterized protein n=1 Tax=Rhododendron molle TaxID=49168 RepID=A0ACC0MHQ9_RHOML|nr:hypothetical protein RHMOL_Rhmol09G0215100 [Rhododendron molle]
MEVVGITTAFAFVAVFGKREDARALAKLLSGHLANTFGELALLGDVDASSYLFIPWGICILTMDTADENVGELYVRNAIAEGVAPVGDATVVWMMKSQRYEDVFGVGGGWACSLRILQHVESIQVPLSWKLLESESEKDVTWVKKQFREAPGKITALIQREIMKKVGVEGYGVTSFKV